MKKLIILSDTHGNNQLIDKILSSHEYDIAIHAGDYETDVNYMIKNFNYFVRGNNDFDAQKDEIYFEIEGIKFNLQHGQFIGSYNDLDNDDLMRNVLRKKKVDVLIHGHTHITKIVYFADRTFIINPGSIWLPRGGSKASYILATIHNGVIDFEVKFVDHL
ncbi:MAG: metallophosphoesterase family protein [Metamycoplasmataceae bacterium]